MLFRLLFGWILLTILCVKGEPVKKTLYATKTIHTCQPGSSSFIYAAHFYQSHPQESFLMSGKSPFWSIFKRSIDVFIDTLTGRSTSYSFREDPPSGLQDGINYIDDSTVTLILFAPGKNTVHAIGDFNNWQVVENSRMTLSEDGERFWITVPDLEPGKPYAFQYLIDESIRIGDPYSELILDPNHDFFISDEVFPDMPPFPTLASDIVSVLQTAQEPYQWKTDNWQKPEVEDLVIYELLVRDFIEDHSYLTLIDTLDYLERLGINAIELMPIMEFEANISWGYNPSYHMAVDKYYGKAEHLKAFIDECHSRGIVVILDMVLNHAFGQSPLVRMYWDIANNRPTEDSPYFNPIARHPFNVGYDFNHESLATQTFVDRIMDYWLREFRFDGYRMDLSKGFTQKDTGDDIGAWSAYDASRISLLKRMADSVWSKHPDTYLILEHFADNQEERELEAHGFQLWTNQTFHLNEAMMGYHENGKSDFSRLSYQSLGWTSPNLIGYLESHDEERLMYKTLEFGNSAGTYNTQELNTALERLKQLATFFFAIPGPKMFWQFGELGYEIPIDFNGRTGEKPILWEYRDDPRRLSVYETYSELIRLRQKYEVFQTQDFSLDLFSSTKRIVLRGNNHNIVVMGNFDVVERTFNPRFTQEGFWYDFFAGDSLEVNDLQAPVTLAPGAYHLFSDQPISLESPILSTRIQWEVARWKLYPNPSEDVLTIEYEIEKASKVVIIISDLQGKKLTKLWEGTKFDGTHSHQFNHNLAPGVYLVELVVNGHKEVKKWILHP